MPPKQKEIVFAINDMEHWEQILEESQKCCIVIDCHQDWCGPCETLEPTFRKLWMEIEDCDSRVKFYTANIKTLKEGIAALLPPDNSLVNLDTHGCMPFFLVIRFGAMVSNGLVLGVNSPSIVSHVNLNLPEKVGEQEN